MAKLDAVVVGAGFAGHRLRGLGLPVHLGFPTYVEKCNEVVAKGYEGIAPSEARGSEATWR
jgi:hypothetical protein